MAGGPVNGVPWTGALQTVGGAGIVSAARRDADPNAPVNYTGIIVPTVLQMAADTLAWFTGLTCLYDRYWTAEADKVTLLMVITFAFSACDTGNGSQPLETVASPTATPPEGTYTSTQNVTLSSTTAGASIYYTLDGAPPTESSTPYTNAILIEDTKTLKAIAIKSGMNNSGIMTAVYTLEKQTPTADDFDISGIIRRDSYH
jgi:hypothetical protein